MPKTITLLGSTGSIGTQSLDVARMHGYRIFGLAANSRVEILQKQIEEFHPEYVAVVDPVACEKLDAALAGTANAPKLLKGPEGLRTLAAMDGPDVVLNAVVGIAGLPASLAAIESGHDLALANKESLVVGGELVMKAVESAGVELAPVDSCCRWTASIPPSSSACRISILPNGWKRFCSPRQADLSLV